MTTMEQTRPLEHREVMRRIALNKQRRLRQETAMAKRTIAVLDEVLRQKHGLSVMGLLTEADQTRQDELLEMRTRLAWRGEHIQRLDQFGSCGVCGICQGKSPI